MIKLLSKFDHGKMHPSLATPTCGCCSCCCCCCCIATALASSAITSRSFGRAAQAIPEKTGNRTMPRLAGNRILAYIGGFFAFPVFFIGSLFLLAYILSESGLSSVNGWVIIAIPFLIYCLVLFALGRFYRVSRVRLAIIAGLTAAGMAGEFYIILSNLDKIDEFNEVFVVETLVGAMIFGLYLIWEISNRRNKKT